MVIADSQLADRSDHARRQMAVGLTCRDLEVSRQHCTREGDNHFVALNKVVRTADDALNAGRINALASEGLFLSLRNHPDLAPVDGLAIGLRFLDQAQDLA